jgi:putative ABC transport system ATP-binding protein
MAQNQPRYVATIDNIIKEFPSGSDVVRVLHGVSMSIDYGKLTMLIGPSGCGKTTVLSILTGTLSATSGNVSVLGERLDRLNNNNLVRFRRRNIGFIFQQYNLIQTLSAAENAAVALIADGMAWEDATAKAGQLLDQLGLGPHKNKMPRQLSGGQQQRVAIARALANDPALVVCDEPTAALDADSGHAVMELLDNASHDPTRAVLVVTHDDRIFSFADRIIKMEDGRVIDDGLQSINLKEAH